jgi:hypothetical protein
LSGLFWQNEAKKANEYSILAVRDIRFLRLPHMMIRVPIPPHWALRHPLVLIA